MTLPLPVEKKNMPNPFNPLINMLYFANLEPEEKLERFDKSYNFIEKPS